MDDDYGADDALIAAMAAADPAAARPVSSRNPPTTTSSSVRQQQPTPQRIQQPTPQRLDKAPPKASTESSGNKIVQPTPQALPQRQSGSTILVSPRQRGNPLLTSIKSVPWEYSDIPADYVLGATSCALFLSLKYHRLHPEYIYTRIRNLQGKYNLRVLLTMVDIPNHEDPLRELSKTSLVNNVTLILCWSAAEAARYLELYKSYENASFGAIRGQQASSYADKLVDFVTVPRSLNKSDAVALVANFGSLKNAVNADQEQLGMLNGWGGTKVKRWVAALDEPFRVKKAAKRGVVQRSTTTGSMEGAADTAGVGGAGDGNDRSARLHEAIPLSRVPLREMTTAGSSSSRQSPAQSTPAPGGQQNQGAKQFSLMGDVSDDDDHEGDEEAMLAAAIEESKRTAQPGMPPQSALETQAQDDTMSGGVAAALAKLRENGG